MTLPALVVTDLDGTLRRTDGGFNAQDLRVLEDLGRNGTIRVVATGRSLYSYQRGVGDRLPLDYIIFSSGAGVLRVRDGAIIRKIDLEEALAVTAAERLMADQLDFMIHRPVPDNHYFSYYATGADNPDFYRRIERYREFASLLTGKDHFGPASQLLAVVNEAEGPAQYDRVRQEFGDLSVIRSTSPLDHRSTWIEIFSPDVSKSRTTAWLAAELGIASGGALCLGNDYNDQDLLEWADQGFVVSNAPEQLRRRFRVVSSNDEGGLAEAVGLWMHQYLSIGAQGNKCSVTSANQQKYLPLISAPITEIPQYR